MIDLEAVKKIGKELPPAQTNPAPGFLCLYTAPDGAHCIIGKVCLRLGLEIPACNESDNQVAVGYLATNKAGRWHGLFTTEAIVWASQAQLLGQMGYPWRVCCKSADNSVASQITHEDSAKDANGGKEL